MSASRAITESVVEELLLDWFDSLGYEVLNGADIAPGEPAAERDDYREALLVGRLEASLRRLNPTAPASAVEEALRRLRRTDSPDLVENNRRLHRMLVDGVDVELAATGGGVRGHRLKILDFENPDENDWLAVNQFTVEGSKVRRPDVVVFVNGIPLAVGRAERPDGRAGHGPQGLQSAPDLQAGHPGAVRHERAARSLRRSRGAPRLAHRAVGVVPPVADDRRRRARRTDGEPA